MIQPPSRAAATIQARDDSGEDGVVVVWGLHYPVISDFVTLWTVACQAPLSVEYSRQEYWSGLPFPSPGSLHYFLFDLEDLHQREILWFVFQISTVILWKQDELGPFQGRTNWGFRLMDQESSRMTLETNSFLLSHLSCWLLLYMEVALGFSRATIFAPQYPADYWISLCFICYRSFK